MERGYQPYVLEGGEWHSTKPNTLPHTTSRPQINTIRIDTKMAVFAKLMLLCEKSTKKK